MLFLLLYSVSESIAQKYDILNGHFIANTSHPDCIGPNGANDLMVSGCLTFSNNHCVPNWNNNRGTPDHRATGDRIHIWANDNVGEAISGGYTFIASETYFIDLHIYEYADYCMKSGGGTGTIFLVATNTLQSPLSGCGDVLGIPSGSQIIGTFSGSSWLTRNHDVKLNFTSNSNYSYIYIYHSNDCGQGSNPTIQNELIVEYVTIRKCLLGDIVYAHTNYDPGMLPHWANPTIVTTVANIPSGLTARERIAVGSYTTYPTQPVLNSIPYENTRLIGRSVELDPALSITVNYWNTFVAEAVWDCGDGTYAETEDPPPPPPSSKPGRTSNLSNAELEAMDKNSGGLALYNLNHGLQCYPNPTTGSFTLQLPQSGNYNIRVMNLIGSTVYEDNMIDKQIMSIQLDSSLPPGNYTIHISGEGLRHVEKLTLTR